MRRSLQIAGIHAVCGWHGPIFAGKIFPFCFITIACGAISGFHALISSGTTPKMIAREWHALACGIRVDAAGRFRRRHGAGCGALLDPGVFFAVNSPAGVVGGNPPPRPSPQLSSWGFPVAVDQMATLPGSRRERACSAGPAALLRSRSAWRTSSRGPAAGEAVLSFWYHFAIMFEALFILTIIDAGTRVGRFMLQDLLGHVYEPLGRTGWMPGVVITSAVDRGGLGLFPVSGRARSAGRNQFPVAALRHCEPVADCNCTVRCDNDLRQDASRQIHVDYGGAARMVAGCNIHGRMGEDLFAGAATWVLSAGVSS